MTASVLRASDIPMHTRVRFIRKIAVAGQFDCWEWTASKNADGYGTFNVSGIGTRGAQRVAYAVFNGEAPAELTVDHLCGNRGCVNPAHLEAVPHRVNVLRSSGVAAGHARRTHCKNNHPLERYDGPNSGQRYCPLCKRENGRDWARRRRGSQPERYRV